MLWWKPWPLVQWLCTPWGLITPIALNWNCYSSTSPISTIGQLFAILSEVLKCLCGDYGNPFHITLVRGVKFRSESAKDAYFKQVDPVVEQWRKQYPQGIQFGDGGVDFFANREKILKHYLPQLETGVTVDSSWALMSVRWISCLRLSSFPW